MADPKKIVEMPRKERQGKSRHSDIYDMPDIGGTNRDHDRRYFTRGVDIRPGDKLIGGNQTTRITVADTAPANPKTDDIWIDTSGDTKPYLTPTNHTAVKGTPTGSLSDMTTPNDGNVYELVETGGVPGFNLVLDFTNVVSIDEVIVNAWYVGLANHYVWILLYNYDTTSFDIVNTMARSYGLYQYSATIFDDTNYISSGASQISFYHNTTGTGGNVLSVDYVALRRLV